MRVGLRRLSTAVAREADGAARLLQGARPLIQPHSLRPQGTTDMLTGRPVKATNESLGIELPNVDLTQDFSFEECEVLKQASDDAGGIVVFTNQKDTLDIHGHRRFAKTMADSENTAIERQPVVAGHPDEGDVMEIVREASANVVFGENWHSDHSFMDYTASYSILRGAVVPRLGVNDTLFSSTEDAFDGLSQTMQNLILDLNAFHSANKAYGAGHPGNSRAAMEGTDTMTWKDDAPILEADVLQPVVSVHPRTGRKGIYVSPTFTTHIDGMRAEESKAVLLFLCNWIARPDFCTRVSWQPNQVVMWDNRSLSHKGLADDLGERRVVHRVTLRGASPVNHRGQNFSLTHKTQAAAGGLWGDVFDDDPPEGLRSKQQMAA
jgi:taurine dioxygenase